VLSKILLGFVWVPFKIVLQYYTPLDFKYTTLATPSKRGGQLSEKSMMPACITIEIRRGALSLAKKRHGLSPVALIDVLCFLFLIF